MLSARVVDAYTLGKTIGDTVETLKLGILQHDVYDLDLRYPNFERKQLCQYHT